MVKLFLKGQEKVVLSRGNYVGAVSSVGRAATLDCRVSDSYLVRGRTLCPWARHFINILGRKQTLMYSANWPS